ncbi:hypothetical protein F2Q70_00043994 [Brassica cretica]|uniref:Uncharacterized protein n=1 Tax=Brassica cretica TaxID=69181 RepID=A0A8S9KHT2_BRACR|nr:hypothetical protein F2Q70_00043994 [Brassica cretica]
MRVASPLPRESAKSMQADREASALQPQAPMLAEQRSVGVPKRIASAIVTPSRGDSSDGNVTKRFKGTPRSLAFETLTQQDPKPATEDEQVIEALNDMDITVQLDGGMMDCEMQNDDLMGLELAEMEEKSGHERADHGAEQISQKPTGRSSKHIKHGYKSSGSLGGQTKKFEILLRGSPQKRSSSSLSVRVPSGTGGSRRHHHNDQVIEALNDMDITEQLDGGLMDCEMENDDLMGLELAEMEDKNGHDRADHVADQKSQKLAGRSSRHIKHGYKSSASLGIQKKKFEILLRGSPQKRSSSSLAAPIATSYFRQIFESSNPEEIEEALAQVPTTITGDMNDNLTAPKIHSGYEIKVWEDPWIPSNPARPAVPIAPVMHPNMREFGHKLNSSS